MKRVVRELNLQPLGPQLTATLLKTEIVLPVYLWGACAAGHTSLDKPTIATNKAQLFNYLYLSIRD